VAVRDIGQRSGFRGGRERGKEEEVAGSTYGGKLRQIESGKKYRSRHGQDEKNEDVGSKVGNTLRRD